ncbi:carotenoid ester lipase precursor [Desarmillaria ectypa]|nr:carotenoid ester lipase precursor [Desarmillaria ectypa]
MEVDLPVTTSPLLVLLGLRRVLSLLRLFRAVRASATLDSATFTGTTYRVVSRFLGIFSGIPFAQSPTGDRRFRLPETLPAYNGSYDTGYFGPSCPQQAIRLLILTEIPAKAVDYLVGSIYDAVLPDDEDCLTVNVLKSANATSNFKLPVIVALSFYGCDGTSIVTRSIALNQPVICVSMNCRVSVFPKFVHEFVQGFGFPASKKFKEAVVGNLVLHNQREALRCIHKDITTFSGDPTKMGRICRNYFSYDCLFRAPFMQSESPIPVGDLGVVRNTTMTSWFGQAALVLMADRLFSDTLKLSSQHLAEVQIYFKTDLATLLELHSADPLEGSPNSRRSHRSRPMRYSRRREGFFYRDLSSMQNIQAFCKELVMAFNILGAFRTSDILNVYLGGDMADYLIHFAATLNPSESPQWTNRSPNLLTFNDSLLPVTITQDTFRSNAMNGLSEILFRNPI